jgi:Amt family ammonium transporter
MQLLNLALFTIISGYTSKLIRDSMQRSRNHQNELLDANRELEAIRASLEYQVHERTSEILQQKQYFEALMHNNPLAIAALDQNHHVVAINQAFEKLFGYLPVEAIGHDLDSLVTTPETLAEALIYTHRSQIGEQVLGHGKRRRKDGSLVDVDIFGVPVTIEGKQIGILGIYQDVSARKQSEEQLQYLATHDLLTGLPNRNLFNDRLNRAFERSRRNGHAFAVFFLDLDGFKQVNDTFGHHKGDLVLQQVANRLKNCVRESDTLARVGGDEFSYIFEDLKDIQSAIHVSSKILDQLKEPFVLDEKEVWITASIGISLYPDDGEDTDTLLKKADAAMYQAKEWGGDTISLSNGAPATIEARNTELWIG